MVLTFYTAVFVTQLVTPPLGSPVFWHPPGAPRERVFFPPKPGFRHQNVVVLFDLGRKVSADRVLGGVQKVIY